MEVESLIEKNLVKTNDVELLLLKGHLILERCITELLTLYIQDMVKLEKMQLMFAKKLELYIAISGKQGISEEVKKQIVEINRLRNKLSHELDFTKYEPELKKWACNVLGYVPTKINRRKTYRNTVAKAFSCLAGMLSGYKRGIEATTK